MVRPLYRNYYGLLKQSDGYRMGNPRTAVARDTTAEEEDKAAQLELSGVD